MTAFLEIACFDANSAITACEAGADRIELCDGREVGGTTPSHDSFTRTLVATKRRSIPLSVMIRPRGGNFVYSDVEYAQMKMSIDVYKTDASGFVLGILTEDGRVDVPRTRELVRAAHPLPCTFHRAFDKTHNILDSLEDILQTGCKAILSSGGATDALQGAYMLAELVRRADGNIAIMPGGGVRSGNLAEISTLTKARFFHSSALTNATGSPDIEEITKMMQLLRGDRSNDGASAQAHRSVLPAEHDEDAGRSHMIASAVSIGATTSIE